MAKPHIKLPVLTEQQKERFLSKVDKSNLPGCHIWTGAQYSVPGSHYGLVYFSNGTFRAHRVAYLIHYNQDPLEKQVMHSCDNPPCVNPAHLSLGTAQDNINDKVQKGRQAKGNTNAAHARPEIMARGIKSGRAKFTEAQILEIRFLYQTTENGYRRLAKQFNVTRAHIRNIVKRKIWRHI